MWLRRCGEMLALFLLSVILSVPAEAIEMLWGLHREKTPQKFTFLVRYLPSSKCLWITEVNINSLPEKERISAIRISAVKKPDDSILFQKEFPLGDKKRLENFGIESVDFSDGAYGVKGELLDVDGKVTASEMGRTQISFDDLTSGKHMVGGMLRNAHMTDWTKPYTLIKDEFTLKKNPFTNNMLGKSGGVIPPFEPVTISSGVVNVWGRTYHIADTALPRQITGRQPEPTVGGEYEDLLFAPVRLSLQDENGEKEFKPSAPLKTLETSDSCVVVEGSCLANDWHAIVRNTIEQDGAMKIELKVAPAKGSVKALYLDIPLRESQAVLKHDLTDVAYRKIHREKKGLDAGIGTQAGFTPNQKREDGIVWDSAETEKKGTIGTFQPMVWLGNEDRGLCWFADSDKGWILDDMIPALQIIRKNGRVILRVSLINKTVELQKPFEVTFGLLATPVKPQPAKSRGWIFPRWSTLDSKLYDSLRNVRKIVEVGAGDPKFNAGMASPLAKDWNVTRNLYGQLRDNNSSTYMEYWCSDYLTMDAPAWESYFGEWMYPKNSSWFNHRYTGHSEPSCAWLAFQRITPSAQDYKAWCVDKKLKEVGLFAYYEDNSHTRLFDDPALGYGYAREDGKRQPQFDIWEYRGYLKRIAAIYRDNGHDSLFGVHSSAQMMIPAFTFASITIDGEQPARYVIDQKRDYIDVWPDMEYIRAHVMGRQFGVKSLFLSEITAKDDPDGRLSRSLLALMLPHDIEVWDGAMPNRSPVRVWHQIKNDFNFLEDDSSFFPYWAKTKAASTDKDDVIVTVWKIKERLLILLSNIGEETDVRVSLNTDILGMKEFLPFRMKDAENDSPVPCEHNAFKAKVKRHDFRVFRLDFSK